MITSLDQSKTEILYVQDALCGWCYGFSPVIDQIREQFGNRLTLTAVHGGLWPGSKARKMDKALVSHLLAGMPKVTAATGQIFGAEFREKIVNDSQFVYDTEPAARAAIVVRDLRPENELDFIKDIQTDFFLLGHDPTRAETFLNIVKGYGIESSDFIARYESSEMIENTLFDFAKSAAWGVAVFPTLLYRQDGRVGTLVSGSCTIGHVSKLIEPMLGHVSA